MVEEEKPKEPKEEKPEDETRLDALEKSIGEIKETLKQVLNKMSVTKDVFGGPINPSPEGGDVKLPKSVGDADPAKPEGDKEQMVEKMVEKKFEELIKGMNKTTTPRPQHEEISKEAKVDKDFAMDLLKRAEAGKLTVADMTREIKNLHQKNYDEQMSKFLEGR